MLKQRSQTKKAIPAGPDLSLTDKDHHPTDAELRQYCDGIGHEEFIVRIDRHVDKCEVCLPKVVALVRDSMAEGKADEATAT